MKQECQECKVELKLVEEEESSGDILVYLECPRCEKIYWDVEISNIEIREENEG